MDAQLSIVGHFRGLFDICQDSSETTNKTILESIKDDFPPEKLLSITARLCPETYRYMKACLVERGINPPRRQSNAYTLAHVLYSDEVLTKAIDLLTIPLGQEGEATHPKPQDTAGPTDEVANVTATGQAQTTVKAPPCAPTLPPPPDSNIQAATAENSHIDMQQATSILSSLATQIGDQAHTIANLRERTSDTMLQIVNQNNNHRQEHDNPRINDRKLCADMSKYFQNISDKYGGSCDECWADNLGAFTRITDD